MGFVKVFSVRNAMWTLSCPCFVPRFQYANTQDWSPALRTCTLLLMFQELVNSQDWYASFTVMLFRTSQRIQICNKPSFVVANSIANAHSDCTGSMTFMRSILSFSAFENSLFLGPARYGAELLGLTSGGVNLMQGLSHIKAPSTSVSHFLIFCKPVQDFLTISKVLCTSIDVVSPTCI